MRRFFISFMLSCLFFSCESGEPKLQELRGSVFGTSYGIQYFDSQNNQKLVQAVDSVFYTINASLSTYLPNSIISRINKNTHVKLDNIFIEVYQASLSVYKDTEGRFDPTIGGLVNAWDFGPEGAEKDLDSLRIAQLMTGVGFNKISIFDNELQKSNNAIYIDFNAIAKGFAVDEISKLLDRFGFHDYVVEIGGEIRTSGHNLDKNKDWKIGIDKPNFDGTQSMITAIELKNQSMATSGVYRHYWVNDQGFRYAHIIDTKTGFPSRTDILSVSVIANQCMIADAFATALQSMNSSEADTFLKKHLDLKVMLITAKPDGDLELKYYNGFPSN